MRVSAASSVGSGRLRDCTLAGRGGRGAPRLVWEAKTWLEKPQDCTSSVWAQWDEHGQRNQVRVSAASSVGSGRLRDCTLAGRGGRGAPRLVWEAKTWLEKPQDCTSRAARLHASRERESREGGPKIGVGGQDMAGEAPGLHQQCVGPMG